jgi:hypothetical protein
MSYYKKVYTKQEVLSGGSNYNSNYANPNYKAFVETQKELFIIIEILDDGYCGEVVKSNFFEFPKLYFAFNMFDSLKRHESRWTTYDHIFY